VFCRDIRRTHSVQNLTSLCARIGSFRGAWGSRCRTFPSQVRPNAYELSNFEYILIVVPRDTLPAAASHSHARLKEARQCAASMTSSDHRSTCSLGTLVVSRKLVASSYRVEYRYNGRPGSDGCGTAGSAEPSSNVSSGQHVINASITHQVRMVQLTSNVFRSYLSYQKNQLAPCSLSRVHGFPRRPLCRRFARVDGHNDRYSRSCNLVRSLSCPS
jgi:hypothetical protein